jgi:predicted glycoside hydrolase/deacetylase ChbG (UPF0249 family)
MHPNPVLRKLGFSDDDRVAIIHADDIGMCQATLPAFAELVEFGLVSSGAVMVPCPWFPQAAAYCRQTPGVDVGVHLTLTSEWETYRWGPISTRDPASGLMDGEGYFHERSEQVQENGDATAAQRELEAQVSRALTAGIDVTHVDTHMGAVAHPKFFPAYLQTGLPRRLPMMIPRLDEAGFREVGLDAGSAVFAASMIQELEAQGLPLLDRVVGLPLEEEPGDRMALVKGTLDSLPPGLTHLFSHPAVDTPELRAITPRWRSRVADFYAFSSTELRDHVRASGVQVIGYRVLRELMPAAVG